MKSLRDKILDAASPVIFYELLPPMVTEATSLMAYVDCAIDLITCIPITIDALNIPEIRAEEQNGHQKEYVPKMDARIFAKILGNALSHKIDMVLNHCTVYEPLAEQLTWLESSIQDYDLRHLVLVGGSSSKVRYPGPSILEMGSYIREHYQPDQLFCGGIAIQTRRSNDALMDEPNRLILKGENGLSFFTSQIIYEPDSMKRLLGDYDRICREQGTLPKRVFMSFAPISSHKDLDFLRWLGVSIPGSVEKELFKADIGIGWRSVKIAVNLLQDILSYMQQKNINVPLGLNIEHITRHNFELSLTFMQHLGRLYNNYAAMW